MGTPVLADTSVVYSVFFFERLPLQGVYNWKQIPDTYELRI